MEDIMQVYRFVNGSDIISVASVNEQNAQYIALCQALKESPVVMVDKDNPETIEQVMSYYKNVTKH